MSTSTQQAESAFTFLPRGASIQEFRVAGRNIVQGFPEAALYASVDHPYLGETIGRTTNRIRNAKLHHLNGRTYELSANSVGNSLHGGQEGWGTKDWDGPYAVDRSGRRAVLFTYLSKDGEEGFPGTVEARVWYTTSNDQAGRTELEIEYEAELIGDECDATVVGMTNHSYFNLNLPAPDITNTVVRLGSTSFLESDSTGIPTGRILPFPGIPSTAFTPFTLTAELPDPDDCFVVNPDPASVCLDTRNQPLKTLAMLYHPESGLHLVIESTEPAFQFYCGRYVNVPETVTSSGVKVPARGRRCGICIEPSRYVDSPGREEWRNQCLLKKGQLWGSRTLYRAWKD